ncbi:MAG: NADH:ubiquinone oxidoreductase subunit RnfG [Zetaproteobacteria bacterium CG_4_10_14_0_2_um_filter_55_20]|nr:MAG: NADH:ubiquinone oxidoreductase subunit RnfG [Zetaproteobacteria bacterium CG1_02_55_237]PIS18601.1 MAG: NADH:ubiquinone oxidoreductase subunit RnfG [Zetaproteobacteria bacterium CG08_land_8_20_14_0_20_55_17]PIY54432.1 MAG: NADH:ubiquinone oxidoreductase subunit RnfG [Zetaproteobacteria bacterium CG_4_10_14_0_8_um_filter_55_43]PIZ36808.1 MAG: NADH:ubiquinone oxidoreductase subunit RnfG [Zetaproteobacteria bacterium CG_4_10_14_0_2_um_filter_55_20]PJB79842.1 MAG: NADH:ubiquinone oxidoreduc
MSASEKKTGGINRDMVMMVVALTLVTAISAALLGLTDVVTREPILEAQRAALQRNLEQVLPKHANVPMDDVIRLSDDDAATPFYVARDADGALLALAWEVVAPDGYSGSIRILMGVLPDGALHAVRITDHRETPGLGDGIVQNRKWIDFFIGKSLGNVSWAVKKDGGDFDQFTGATITPRAVVKAVHRGLEFFAAQRDALLARAAGK